MIDNLGLLTGPVMLEVRNLSFAYHDQLLLEEIEFTVKGGQLLHLRGDNGAGKTTLLKLLGGLLFPLKGEIRYQGQSIAQDLSAYQRQLCFVGHRLGVNPSLTVKENVFFDLHLGKREASFEGRLADFGLSGLDNELCAHLSSGQRKRLGLVRLGMTDARLWLLDEPLVALDQGSVDKLMSQFKSHLHQNGQIIVTSHQDLPLNSINYKAYSLS